MSSKILVDNQTQKIVGGFKSPYRSSLEGKYIVDVPDYLGVVPETDSVSDLYQAKKNAFLALHPAMAGAQFSEELKDVIDPDPTVTFGAILSPNKGAGFIPNPSKGTVSTFNLTIPFAITKVFLHWSMFTLTRVSSPDGRTDKTLYNWDPGLGEFVEPSPGILAVDLMDPNGDGSLLTVTPDTEMDFPFGPGDFKIRFFNDTNTLYYVSEFYLLYG